MSKSALLNKKFKYDLPVSSVKQHIHPLTLNMFWNRAYIVSLYPCFVRGDTNRTFLDIHAYAQVMQGKYYSGERMISTAAAKLVIDVYVEERQF